MNWEVWQKPEQPSPGPVRDEVRLHGAVLETVGPAALDDPTIEAQALCADVARRCTTPDGTAVGLCRRWTPSPHRDA